MIETTIVIWLMTGATASGPISPSDCERHISTAWAAVESGGYVEFEGPGFRSVITRMQCDGRDTVIALPPSEDNCGEAPGS